MTCLVREEKLDGVIDSLLRYTTTKGVRYAKFSRRVMASTMESTDTPYGRITLKKSVYGDMEKVKPEFDDLARAAADNGVTIAKVRGSIEYK